MKRIFINFFVIVLIAAMSSCENTLDVTLPQGPEGPQGPKGDSGKSAFELWLEYNGKDPGTSIEEFFSSMKGKDGKDGDVPYVGDNGNWWVGNKDTSIPARGTDGNDGQDGTTPTIGNNGNWFIDEKDTGVLAKGKDGNDGNDGVNGKTAYELWKEAVDRCDGTVVNKDGSAYDCSKNTWQDFLKWLQGGDTSVLYQYWTTLPGNSGKTMNDFITELFDCHCDGITISSKEEGCLVFDNLGNLTGKYYTTLSIGGAVGTSFEFTVNGKKETGTIKDLKPISFSIERTNEDVEVAIKCTVSGKKIDKKVTIPGLKYETLKTNVIITAEPNNESLVTINLTSAPKTLEVDAKTIYTQMAGIDVTSGWAVSNNGKTFTKKYKKAEVSQTYSIEAEYEKGCATTAFTIESLTKVSLKNLGFSVSGNCEISIKATGTEGMEIVAKYGANLGNEKKFTESSGTYTLNIPRTYEEYKVYIEATKAGYGKVTDSLTIGGTALFTDIVQIKDVVGEESNNANNKLSYVKKALVNNSSSPLTVTINRSAKANDANSNAPIESGKSFPYTITIGAGSTEVITIPRDYKSNYGEGSYKVSTTSTNACGAKHVQNINIAYQTTFQVEFYTKADGSGGYSVNYEITAAIPNSYLDMLFTTTKRDGALGYATVVRKQISADGTLKGTINFTKEEYENALEGKNATFKFYRDAIYTSVYEIGSVRELVPFIIRLR